MSTIQQFGKDILREANHHRSSLLADYGYQLIEYSESFNVKKVTESLQNFSGIMTQLEQMEE